MICRATHQRSGLFDEIIVDNFAGGGGASIGLEQGAGMAVDLAINHDREAVAMHRVNHPYTRHLCQDVFDIDPVEATGGRPVGLAWFSPDCTYFSKARGGKPIRNTKRRDLAWVVIRWAKTVKPRIIMLENVEEFQHWGPLDDQGKPCKKRRGRTFRSWTGQLREAGYDVQWRELRACDYGAPTIRKRFFLIARCDGQPIIWPEVTHGNSNDQVSKSRSTSRGSFRRNSRCNGKTRTYELGTRGVFGDSGRSGRALGGSKKEAEISIASRDEDGTSSDCGDGYSCSGGFGIGLKPYRTAADCIDWSIPCPSIFERKKPLADNTLRRIAAGIKRHVIESAEPFIVRTTGKDAYERTRGIDKPMRTVTAGFNDEALVVPTLVQTGYGERPPRWRCGSCEYEYDRSDLPTCGCVKCGSQDDPVLIPGQKPRVPGLHKPLGTVVGGGQKHALVAAFLAGVGGRAGQSRPRCVSEPTGTTTAKADAALTAVHLTTLRGTSKSGRRLDEPHPTVTSGSNHAGLVAALLVKYYGCDLHGQSVTEPLHTIPTKERFGLVTVHIDGEPYVITDIGMRMLQPRELYRAQGFGDDYIIDHGIDEEGERVNLTKTAQVRMCGNSVAPPVVRALVSANLNVESREGMEVLSA